MAIPSVTQLGRYAPFAAQAVAAGRPELLGAVLSHLKVSQDRYYECSRDMLVAFSFHHFGSPSFAPRPEPERMADALSQMPPEAQCLYEGACLAAGTGPRNRIPRFKIPDVEVVSNPDLVSRRAGEVRCVNVAEEELSAVYREAVLDLRDIRFIHGLSEGKASRLVAAKVRKMKGQLRKLAAAKADPETVLRWLLSGDKNSTEDLAKVGRYGTGPFYLLNGHRRLAALCALAAQGEIPLAWLRRIPVWVHDIKSGEAVRDITAGTMLETTSVLGEVRVGGYSPAEAYQLLRFLPRLEPTIAPIDLPRIWKASKRREKVVEDSFDHRKKGELGPLSEDDLCLFFLKRMAEDLPDSWHPFSTPFMERLRSRPHLFPRVFDLFEETLIQNPKLRLAFPNNWLSTLSRTAPDRVRSFFDRLLEREPFTSEHFDFILSACVDDLHSRQADLTRFVSHPDPAVRLATVPARLGQAPTGHLNRLLNMLNVETDPQVRESIYHSMQNVSSDIYKKKLFGGDPSYWRRVDGILTEYYGAGRHNGMAGRIAEALEQSQDTQTYFSK